MNEVAEAAADDGGELKKLCDELKRLREAIEARPFVGPLPTFVPVIPYIVPPYMPMPWQQPVITWTVGSSGGSWGIPFSGPNCGV